MNWPSCRRSVEAERRDPVEATMPRLDLQLLTTTLDPLACLAAWQRQLADLPGGMPAAEAHFTGRVRGVSGQGLPLEALELEPPLTLVCSDLHLQLEGYPIEQDAEIEIPLLPPGSWGAARGLG